MIIDVAFEVCKGYEYADIELPKRATKFSVGYDFSCPHPVVIGPKSKVMIPTHVKCSMPPDVWLGVFSRSSLHKRGLHHFLGCGVIDSDYYGNSVNDGDIGVILENTTDEPVHIKTGEKIAQGIFFHAFFGPDEVEEERTGGFGSTDKEE